ncbi:MAG: nucleotidyltransferase domain-containing protein [Rickettsiales bacterium]
MNLAELRTKKPEIIKIADEYGVSDIRVFGSVARGDEGDNSDIDLMIKMKDGSIFEFLEFKNKVENLLHTKVDMVEIDIVRNPLRKRYMLDGAVPL